MRKLLKFTFLPFGFIFIFIFFVYLVLPILAFPYPPPDAVQSVEPGDLETPLRRGYFTNFTREEVLIHYQKQFKRSTILSIPLPTYRLNYPPEEAQILIRDQTQSTFLEEIVHPFRESIFINGFEPTDPQYDVWYKGVDFRQKIVVKFIPSSIFMRLLVSLGSIIAIYILTKEWLKVGKDLLKTVRKRR